MMMMMVMMLDESKLIRSGCGDDYAQPQLMQYGVNGCVSAFDGSVLVSSMITSNNVRNQSVAPADRMRTAGSRG